MGYLDSINGVVDIHCSKCREKISSGPYMGFNTAICDNCKRGTSIVDESIPLELRDDQPDQSAFQEFVQDVSEAVGVATVAIVEAVKKVATKKSSSPSGSKINLKKKM